jgi:DNA-directed RNA polymerase subunit M/transcription elongation factor TFIIS
MSYKPFANIDISTGFKVPEEKNIATILKEYSGVSGSEKIKTLISLTYKNGTPLLSLEDNSGFVFEVIGLLQKVGYDKTLDFLKTLKTSQDTPTSKLVFKSDIFAKQKEFYVGEISKIRDAIKVKEGTVTCIKCGEKNTLESESQTRSSDEMKTYKVYCYDCGITFVR